MDKKLLHLRKPAGGAACGTKARAVWVTSRPDAAECPYCRRAAGLPPAPAPARSARPGS